ncbi:hypothetical protein [Sinorhizobium meliloti]|uniref:hypothetical protein n=1 Tax=Rhizobium meliloti TaxID=382 RepID=UPI000FE0E215|nr:hypothetical protein [Sinorhizobium meliloti]RVO95009.1 hypothetical protein CN089_12550 [Sinorhizobium meliloti]
MPDPKSRLRVERLLRGDFRPDDLTGLFLYARDHCDGREPVAEIGHFVAHHHERNRGLITRATREWCAVARFHLYQFGPDGKSGFDARRMPPATRDYFKIAAKRLGPKVIMRDTKLRQAEAHAMMQTLADRLTQNADGTWALPEPSSQTELDLLKCICSYLVVQPAFDGDRLFDDFIATLKSNALITKEEIRENSESLKVLVQLYAVAAMHNCIVQLDEVSTVRLRGTAEHRKIEVNAPISVYFPGWDRELVNACAIFCIPDIDSAAYCHPDLLANKDWDFELEVGPDRRLSPLR